MWDLVVLGIMAGGVLALVAVGLTLIFGVMDVMNFAHGEFVMLGMIATIFVVTSTGMNPYLAGLLVIIASIPVAYLIFVAIIRPTIGKSLNVQIFATLGLSIALQAAALMFFGSRTFAISNDFAATRLSVLGVQVEVGRVIAFVGGIVLVAALWFFLYRTRVGKQIRAVSEDHYAAKVVGLRINRTYAIVFILGTAFAVGAGVLLAPFTSVNSTTGLNYVLTSFVIVVLGGFGSVGGAFIGGLVVGIIETFAGYFFGTQWMQASIFVLFVLVLAIRPQGFFGKKSLDAAMVGG
ncbi:branched-chain amino acid ABC transporter permease [Gulosibacter molinativorax]|uniref:Branched-chain amino acid ABC transporter permease n=1 Tax=Gulosibacter molinativorax TaxID=256821 RepID=A0ABT7C824_9MICO|nr:branched-chain amino acid ABC transporter permease [Gulosibacter molinativorax]MDJ1371391.1 branched-chain amino acid ABC transporter permease [Gulosibacter molinativorax]QUY62889.1 LivH protein [Gulosibacter molinativorax]